MKYKLGLTGIDCIKNVVSCSGKFNQSSVSSCWCEVRGWHRRHVCCGWDLAETRLLALKQRQSNVNIHKHGFPAVTDILPDAVNLSHLKIILAIGFLTSMLTIGSH
jgi:hypothetical protein